MAQDITLQVEGMTCTGCEKRLGTSLGRLEGVSEAIAEHRTGVVRVRFDPAVTNRAAVAARVATAGFTVPAQSSDSADDATPGAR